jgi:hypothetical protein
MTKEKDQDSRVFDRRTLDRKVKGGQVSSKDVEKYLKSLPDVASKISPSSADDE